MIEQQCTVRHRHTIIYCLLPDGDQPTLLNGSYHHGLLLLSVCHNSSNDLMIGAYENQYFRISQYYTYALSNVKLH